MYLGDPSERGFEDGSSGCFGLLGQSGHDPRVRALLGADLNV